MAKLLGENHESIRKLKLKLNVCFLLKHNLGDCIVLLDGLLHHYMEAITGFRLVVS